MAVTGARGRLGRALLEALSLEGFTPVPWSRPDYDLDDPGSARRVVERDHPDIVIHAAAWTDVDGCARQPDLAKRRNSDATADVAAACTQAGARLVVISTNEVFDGQRGDGLGYGETDVPRPINAYGASKLAGEVGAVAAYEEAGRPQDVLVVRTAWLFGPPGNDFPAKIVAAADRLPADEPLKVVSDEVGSPTYTIDLAQAIVKLISTAGTSGVYHVVNAGQASRFELAARVLAGRRPGRAIVPISRAQFDRPSAPPAWAVLRSTRSFPANGALRPWSDAIDAYLPSLG